VGYGFWFLDVYGIKYGQRSFTNAIGDLLLTIVFSLHFQV